MFDSEFMKLKNDFFATLIGNHQALTIKSLLDFCVQRNCLYLVPMNPNPKPNKEGKTFKKPMFRYSNADINNLDCKDNDYQRKYRAIKHTMSLNHALSCMYRVQRNPKRSYLEYYKLALTYRAFKIDCKKSNLLVIDCDMQDHNSSNSTADINNPNECKGLMTLKNWCHKHRINIDLILNTFTVRTTSGGYHFYFRYNQHQSALKHKIGYLPCIDIITNSSGIVAPCSVFKGKYYSPCRLAMDSHKQFKCRLEPNLLLDTTCHIKSLPNEIYELLQADLTPKPIVTPNIKPIELETTTKEKQIVKKIITRALDNLTNAGAGNRNMTLNKQVGFIYQYFNYWRNDVSEDQINDQITAIALNLGLDISSIKATIHSGMQWGMNHQLLINCNS